MGADSLLNLIFCYALGSRPLLDSRESVRLPLEDSWRASSYNVNKCVALQNFVIMNKLFILWPDKSRFRVDICQGCLWPGLSYGAHSFQHHLYHPIITAGKSETSEPLIYCVSRPGWYNHYASVCLQPLSLSSSVCVSMAICLNPFLFMRLRLCRLFFLFSLSTSLVHPIPSLSVY